MIEPVKSEGGALDAFDQVVDRFGRPVRHVGLVPGDDLVTPFADRAAETANLERHRLVCKVAHDRGNPFDSEFEIGVVVDLTDHFPIR